MIIKMKSKIKSLNKNKILLFYSLALLAGLVFITPYMRVAYPRVAMVAQVGKSLDDNSRIDTTGAGLVSKVAPGEFLPISVKLSNFGNRNKVDVTISYKITDLENKAIYSATETVAVETTASFVKTIQIPFETIPGRYIAKSSITYQNQLVPATTEFPFIVERKVFGLFQNNFYLYGGTILLISSIVGIVSHLYIRRRRAMRFTPFDYSDIPHDKRTFFEILSDTIVGMRERVGDDALVIASNIDGLKIDKETGRVLALTEHPSKIIATLVSEYEKLLGKKVSFSFRKLT